MSKIFESLNVGGAQLSNRVIMAPMTRGRAEGGAIPGKLMAEYYQQRASAGLIITEATAISTQGFGWLNAPGIWNDLQVAGWKIVTSAVHASGGKIFLQLWHMGRVSHPDFLNGQLPLGPSAIAAKGETHTPAGKKSYVTPHELTFNEIQSIIADYASAAKRAINAGFDGVEVHGANGYLLDQFIRDSANKRTDEYGGSINNRLRLLLEVTESIVSVIGAERVGVRLSPRNQYNDMYDSDPINTFTRAAELLNPLNLAYLHTMEPLPGHMMAADGERVTPYMRKVYRGIIIINGGYDKNSAEKAIVNGEADAVAFGLPFLANPDLLKRFKSDSQLNAPDFTSLYTPGAKGYNDYPVL